MSAITALNNAPVAGPTAAAPSTSRGQGMASLSSDEFARIIFTELRAQDPLQPNDTKALLEQLSMLRSIESDMQLTTRMDAIASRSEFASATALIGRRVSGLSEGRVRAEGVVQSVSRTDAGPVVTLADGTRVAISNLDEVKEDAP